MLGEKGKSSDTIDHLFNATDPQLTSVIFGEAKYNHVLILVKEISCAFPASCSL